MSSLAVMWEWTCPTTVDLAGFGTPLCSFGAPWETAATRGILWGDSHAEHMAPMVEAAARGRDAAFVLLLPCPAVLGDDVRREWVELPTYADDCAATRRKAITFLTNRADVQVVLLASSWTRLSPLLSLRGEQAQPDGDGLIERGLVSLMDAVGRPGRQFVLIGQVPSAPGDPVPCLLSNVASIPRRDCEGTGRRVPALFERTHRPLYDRFTRIAAARRDTFVVLPGDRLCSNGTCLTQIGGEPLYRDDNHIRRNLSGPAKREYAERIGLVGVLNEVLEQTAPQGSVVSGISTSVPVGAK
ncbi:MAG: hypothetical protein IT183_00510 [Acidobacteria bacterium]|nr:hypothetical protein [Acidobacteriota bacterium]